MDNWGGEESCSLEGPMVNNGDDRITSNQGSLAESQKVE